MGFRLDRDAAPSAAWTCRDRGLSIAFQQGADTFTLLDLEAGRGIYWVPDAAAMPYHEYGAPLRILLHWWMREQGCQFVHGAAVGNRDVGVLLGGRGGSGKSTTAIASLLGRLGYVSEDYCLVSDPPQPRVHNLYCTAKFYDDTLERLPAFKPFIQNPVLPTADKALVYLYPRYASGILPGFSLRIILLPRITGRTETTVSETPPAGALRSPPAPFSSCPAPGRTFGICRPTS